MRHEWKPMSPRAFMFCVGLLIVVVGLALAVGFVTWLLHLPKLGQA